MKLRAHHMLLGNKKLKPDISCKGEIQLKPILINSNAYKSKDILQRCTRVETKKISEDHQNHLLISLTKIVFFLLGLHKVHCTQDEMQVEIVLPSEDKSGTTPSSHVYLEGLKGYPDVRCQPVTNGGLAEFKLSLKDFFECGVTRMVNKITVSLIKVILC